MAYAVVADIQSALVNVGPWSTTTKPTLVEVTAFIAEVEADMNSVFAGAGITVPVTETSKLPLLRKICCDGTAAKVLRSIQVEYEQAEAFEKIYRAALERIRRNPTEIESVTGSGAYVTGPTPRTEKPYTREGKEW